MKKLLWINIITLCGLIYCLHILLSGLDKTNNEYISNIGKNVLIEKDTLTIIDYSFFNRTYTLSNGKKFNFHLVDRKIIK